MIVGIVGFTALLAGFIFGNSGFLDSKASLQSVDKNCGKNKHHPPFPFEHHLLEDPITYSIISGFRNLSKEEQESNKLQTLKEAIMNNQNVTIEFNRVLGSVIISGSDMSKTSAKEILEKIADFRLNPPRPPFKDFNFNHMMPPPPHPCRQYWFQKDAVNKITLILKERIKF